jgi:RimJ/RimL family protein N-acetyltransferase
MSSQSVEGNGIRLVRYGTHHVPIYHEWMLDEETRALTESEPMTMDDHRVMQESVSADIGFNPRCMFIIETCVSDEFDHENVRWMAVGDIVCYAMSDDDDEGRIAAEINVMIGDRSVRRKGIAPAAVRLMMKHMSEIYGVQKYVAKIMMENQPSRSMFERIGYTVWKEIPAFGEVWMVWEQPTLGYNNS